MWSERERILRRLPAPIFVLRCIGAGIVGACVALAVGFILIGIISIAIYDLEQADDAVNGVIGVLWMVLGALGFVVPIVALRRSRRRPPEPTPDEADQGIPLGLPGEPAQTMACPTGPVARERTRRRLSVPIFVLLGAGIAGACVALAVGFTLIGLIAIPIYPLHPPNTTPPLVVI